MCVVLLQLLYELCKDNSYAFYFLPVSHKVKCSLSHCRPFWSMGSIFLKGQKRYENVKDRPKCQLLIQIPHSPNSPWLWASLSNRSGAPAYPWHCGALGHILSSQRAWPWAVSLSSPSRMLTTFREAQGRLCMTLTVSVTRPAFILGYL